MKRLQHRSRLYAGAARPHAHARSSLGSKPTQYCVYACVVIDRRIELLRYYGSSEESLKVKSNVFCFLSMTHASEAPVRIPFPPFHFDVSTKLKPNPIENDQNRSWSSQNRELRPHHACVRGSSTRNEIHVFDSLALALSRRIQRRPQDPQMIHGKKSKGPYIRSIIPQLLLREHVRVATRGSSLLEM